MKKGTFKHRFANVIFTGILTASLVLSNTAFSVQAEGLPLDTEVTENTVQTPAQDESIIPTPDVDTPVSDKETTSDDAKQTEEAPQTAETPEISAPESTPQQAKPQAAENSASPLLSTQNAANELKLVYGNPNLADEDAFVLLVMGDGFKADEQEKFFTEASNTANYVMATAPFDEFKNSFKIYALGVVSNESGAKGDKSLTYEEAQADTRDTYFKSTYYSGGMQRLLSIGSEGAQKAQALKEQYLPTADYNVIVVNSTTYGGSGGSICVASLNNESLEMMLHELGHTIANLADEYFAGASYAREYVNMTAESNPAKVKWKRFLGKNGIGVYEYDNGGNGWYRPHEECKMRFLGQRYAFCEVCKEGLRDAFCADSNITQLSFQTYADQLRESDTAIDMKQYFILRNGSNKAIGNDAGVADKLTLTFYDENGANPTNDTPTKRGTYQVKASFGGSETYDSCELTATYSLDYPDILSVKADTKVYDGTPVEIKTTVDYDKEYTIGVHYTGQIPYSTTPEKSMSYDSDTAPIVPGTYTASVTVYDKATNAAIGKTSLDFTIKFKTTALADNNSNSYPGAQSYYNNQNIVFAGEGFTAAEQDKFEALAKKYYEYFTSTEPYKEANLYFNYHTVQAISNESGISKPGTAKDTYFGLSLDANGAVQPTELSTGAAMYLGNNQITSYYKATIVIVNDNSVKAGARVDNKRVTIYAGADEAGMKYAAREFLNYYSASPEGTDWMKDADSIDATRTQLLKKLYYFWYGTSYSPILSRAYNETYKENGTAPDIASTFHTYVNGIDAPGISYTMTYYENNNGSMGKQLDSPPQKAGTYFAKADLVPDEGKKTKKVTLNGETFTLPLARGLTSYTIQPKDADKTNLNAAIAAAETKVAETDKYTKDTLDAATSALADAKTVANNEKATQEEVDQACTKLNTAIQGLKEIEVPTPTPSTNDSLTFAGNNSIPATTVKGSFAKDATLNISVITADKDAYKKLKAKVASGMKILGAYDVTVTGEAKGPFTLTFSVASTYEGKQAIVYHMKDNGEIEELKTIVKNASVTVTVDSLSPFMITVNEGKTTDKTTTKDKATKTGDASPLLPWASICILAGAVVVFTIRKRKWL